MRAHDSLFFSTVADKSFDLPWWSKSFSRQIYALLDQNHVDFNCCDDNRLNTYFFLHLPQPIFLNTG